MTIAFHGLPLSLQTDGAWLDAPTPPKAHEPAQKSRIPHVIGLTILVFLADALFWNRSLGISIAIFVMAVFAVATFDLRGKTPLIRPWLLLIVATLPAIEMVQLLSLTFLAAGLIAALLMAHHPQVQLTRLPDAVLGFALRLPLRWLSPFVVLGAGLGPSRIKANLDALRFLPSPQRFLQNWGFPLGGSLVFLALLMDANPMLSRLLRVNLDLFAMVERMIFWGGIALLLAPFLSRPLPMADKLQIALPRRLPAIGINAASALRALIMFNILISVQMMTDISILIGGADLPHGMSYADYAHRGAYPLLATAILAGAFALAARPFLGEHRLIRPLMLLWLAQNMVLCGAAALRLDLYIGAYGLTYMRIYALIWMGLVAAGLGLTLWQTLRGKGNGWLLMRATMVATATLYFCGFVNFAQIIAAQNLSQERPDMAYVCDLGPLAAGAVAQAVMARPDQLKTFRDMRTCPAMRLIAIRHWQEWGFRKARVSRYSVRETIQSSVYENPDRR